MPTFSERSLKELKFAHPLLQKLMKEVIKEVDFTIADSKRGRIAQTIAKAKGFSKVPFGKSAHNYVPCIALDIYPNPIPKNMDTEVYKLKLKALQHVVKRCADRLGIPIRQGVDFNRDGVANDNFVDLPHVELYKWQDYAKQSKLYEG